MFFFFFQAEDGIRDRLVTGVQTCALPIYLHCFQKLGPHPFLKEPANLVLSKNIIVRKSEFWNFNILVKENYFSDSTNVQKQFLVVFANKQNVFVSLEPFCRCIPLSFPSQNSHAASKKVIHQFPYKHWKFQYLLFRNYKKNSFWCFPTFSSFANVFPNKFCWEKPRGDNEKLGIWNFAYLKF